MTVKQCGSTPNRKTSKLNRRQSNRRQSNRHQSNRRKTKQRKLNRRKQTKRRIKRVYRLKKRTTRKQRGGKPDYMDESDSDDESGEGGEGGVDPPTVADMGADMSGNDMGGNDMGAGDMGGVFDDLDTSGHLSLPGSQITQQQQEVKMEQLERNVDQDYEMTRLQSDVGRMLKSGDLYELEKEGITFTVTTVPKEQLDLTLQLHGIEQCQVVFTRGDEQTNISMNSTPARGSYGRIFKQVGSKTHLLKRYTVNLTKEYLDMEKFCSKLLTRDVSLDFTELPDISESFLNCKTLISIISQDYEINLLNQSEVFGYALMKGGICDLLSYLNHGQVSLFDTKNILQQVLTQLQCFTRFGIVNTDFKAQNIVLGRNSDRSVYVQMIDYGGMSIMRQQLNETLNQGELFGLYESCFYSPLNQSPAIQDYAAYRGVDPELLEMSLHSSVFWTPFPNGNSVFTNVPPFLKSPNLNVLAAGHIRSSITAKDPYELMCLIHLFNISLLGNMMISTNGMKFDGTRREFQLGSCYYKPPYYMNHGTVMARPGMDGLLPICYIFNKLTSDQIRDYDQVKRFYMEQCLTLRRQDQVRSETDGYILYSLLGEYLNVINRFSVGPRTEEQSESIPDLNPDDYFTPPPSTWETSGYLDMAELLDLKNLKELPIMVPPPAELDSSDDDDI